MKTKYWIILFTALFAVFAGAALLLSRTRTGRTANIYRDGKCIYSIDLDSVSEAYSFTLRDGDGHENTIEIEPGRIRVVSANCPDRVCVNTGWLEGGSLPIVCMPAKLLIRLEGEAKAEAPFDAVTGQVD